MNTKMIEIRGYRLQNLNNIVMILKLYLIRFNCVLKFRENDIAYILYIPISVRLGEQTVNSLTHVNNIYKEKVNWNVTNGT